MGALGATVLKGPNALGRIPGGTPFWIIELIDHWISDAYERQATDGQILQWAQELGSVDDLPGAQDLTTPDTIAIWTRRIAQQCDSQHERAAKEAALVNIGEHRRQRGT